MHKRKILLLIEVIVSLTLQAQELTVKSMQATNDLSASTQRRLDINKKPCALVKVQLPSPGAVFEGNIIKPTAYKTNEYWVYMTEGSKELHIKHPNYQTLVVNFPDYGIKSLQALCTYTLSLNMAQGTTSVQTQKLTIDYTPASAMVVVDSEPHQGNGHLEFNLPVGSHDYQIMAIGYETAEGSVKLTAGQPRTITEHLVAKKQPAHQAAQTVKKEQAIMKEQAVTLNEDPEITGKTPQQITDLSYYYRNGTGGKTKDYAKAMKYALIAADRGNSNAMVDLGFMYVNGQGVEKNDIEAVKWYRKAAEKGNKWGQTNLGVCYQNGKGVTKDLTQAKYWLEKAAAQGDEDAKKKLEELNSAAKAPSKAIKVIGTILDKKNNPLIGASVRIKGSNIGVVTDFDGNFALQIPTTTGETKLQIKYVGFKTQTITVDKIYNPRLRIVMSE